MSVSQITIKTLMVFIFVSLMAVNSEATSLGKYLKDRTYWINANWNKPQILETFKNEPLLEKSKENMGQDGSFTVASKEVEDGDESHLVSVYNYEAEDNSYGYQIMSFSTNTEICKNYLNELKLNFAKPDVEYNFLKKVEGEDKELFYGDITAQWVINESAIDYTCNAFGGLSSISFIKIKHVSRKKELKEPFYLDCTMEYDGDTTHQKYIVNDNTKNIYSQDKWKLPINKDVSFDSMIIIPLDKKNYTGEVVIDRITGSFKKELVFKSDNQKIVGKGSCSKYDINSRAF